MVEFTANCFFIIFCFESETAKKPTCRFARRKNSSDFGGPKLGFVAKVINGCLIETKKIINLTYLFSYFKLHVK